LADTSQRLIRDALSRAAAEPQGYNLLAGKSDPGLFPSSALARAAADRCKADGLLEVVRTDAKGKLSREICVLTDKGRHYLTSHANPREVLEDFVRVLELRQSDVDALTASTRQIAQSLQSIHQAVTAMLPRVTSAPANGVHHHGGTMNGTLPAPKTTADDIIADVKTLLAEWQAAGTTGDFPLPDLYRQLPYTISIGRFHDALRQLHDDQVIYLHPWTGPLYALPEPALALLVGHEIAYYASVR